MLGDLQKPAIVAVVDSTTRHSANAACASRSEACLDDDKRNEKTEKTVFSSKRKKKRNTPLRTAVVEWIFVSCHYNTL